MIRVITFQYLLFFKLYNRIAKRTWVIVIYLRSSFLEL